MTIWRALAAVVAVVIAGWLTIGLRSSVLEEHGKDRLHTTLQLKVLALGATPAQRRDLTQAAHDLDRAAFLNPDKTPRMYYAQARLALGDKRRALEIARETARDEPDSVEIWRVALAIAGGARDRELQAEALRHLRSLAPVRP